MLELFRQDLFRPADAFQQPDNPHFTNAELSPKRLCMRNTWDFHLSAGGSWKAQHRIRPARMTVLGIPAEQDVSRIALASTRHEHLPLLRMIPRVHKNPA